MFVAIDSREGTFFEFRMRGGLPEVESVCASVLVGDKHGKKKVK